LLSPWVCVIHHVWVIIYAKQPKWPLTLTVRVRLEFGQNHAKVRPELSP
jgi:hypothetical protein